MLNIVPNIIYIRIGKPRNIAKNMQNFYELLNTQPTASLEQLKRNYKQLILQCHPDKLQQQEQQAADLEEKAFAMVYSSFMSADTTDPNAVMVSPQHVLRRKFIAINEAWNTLKDPIKRKLYDAELLQKKFQMHNNVYNIITLNDMRREEMACGDEYGDADEDEDENEVDETDTVKKKLNGENTVVETAAATIKDKESTTHIFYVYDCRCGGQYVLNDESAHKLLQRQRQRRPRRDKYNNKNNGNQQQRQNNGKNEATQAIKDKQHQQQQHTIIAAVNEAIAGDCEEEETASAVDDIVVKDNDDGNHNDNNKVDGNDIGGELIVECTECSLVIIVK